MNGDGLLDQDRTFHLLMEMQGHSEEVKVKTQGVIGREHLFDCFSQLGCNMGTFQYKKVPLEGPQPEVYEFAFAYHPTAHQRSMITRVNWSLAINHPFHRLGGTNTLDNVLAEARCGPNEPIVVFLHVATVKVSYTDRGKG
jgi:hypothetical protein